MTKWYVTNGVDVISFDNHIEAMTFCDNNPDWYELMA